MEFDLIVVLTKVRLDLKTDQFDADVAKLACTGSVKELSTEEMESQKKRTRGVYNDRSDRKKTVAAQVGKYGNLLEKAMDLHGCGGKASKKRRLARRVVEVTTVAQRVATADLSEALEREGDSEDDKHDSEFDDE